MSSFPCCQLVDTPHVHYQQTHDSKGRPLLIPHTARVDSKNDEDVSYKIDPIFTASFFLPSGYIVPVEFKPGVKYHEQDLVFFDDFIYECVQENTPVDGITLSEPYWKVFTQRDKWCGRWVRYLTYKCRDIVHAADNLYECVIECIGLLPQKNMSNWKHIGTVGRKFPPWMSSHDIFSIEINMGNTMYVSPNTGLPCWDLVPERYIGQEEMSVDTQHPSVRRIFERAGKTMLTQIYTVKCIHCGKCKPPKSDDNPDPVPEWVLGFTMGAYILPPAATDVAVDSNVGPPRPASPPPGALTTGKNTAQFDALMPLVDAKTGKQYSTIFLQWKSQNPLPYIMQGDNLLCIFNNEPHPKYMELFDDAMKSAHACNMTDVSPEMYKLMIFEKCLETGEVPRFADSDYNIWVKKRLLEKHNHLVQANEKWAKANTAWKDWLWNLRTSSEKFRDTCNRIAQAVIGIEAWLNGKRYDMISWWVETTVEPKARGEKRVVTGHDVNIADILRGADEIDRLWDILEQSIGGLTTYYLYQIENHVKKIKSCLAAGNARYINDSKNRTKRKPKNGKK